MMREVFNQSMQQHGGAIVNMTADFRNGMPGMAHSRRGARRHEQPDDDRRLRVGACRRARQRGRAGLDRLAAAWTPTAARCSALIPRLKEHVPLRRMGVEAEVSAAIVFLLSPAPAFVTGVTLQIDGAASLGSEIFPIGTTSRSEPFDGFHRAVTPDVLK